MTQKLDYGLVNNTIKRVYSLIVDSDSRKSERTFFCLNFELFLFSLWSPFRAKSKCHVNDRERSAHSGCCCIALHLTMLQKLPLDVNVPSVF